MNRMTNSSVFHAYIECISRMHRVYFTHARSVFHACTECISQAYAECISPINIVLHRGRNIEVQF
jgi:hypothetical protein